MIGVIVLVVSLLTASVVVLFAMMGELYTRVRDSSTVEYPVQSLDSLEKGTKIPLPDEFLHDRAGLILVLSTSCGTCEKVATQAPKVLSDNGIECLGIVISTSSYEASTAFAERHTLTTTPYLGDLNGVFARGTLGVDVSPAAVALDHCASVRSAVAFAGSSDLSVVAVTRR